MNNLLQGELKIVKLKEPNIEIYSAIATKFKMEICPLELAQGYGNSRNKAHMYDC